MVSFWSFFLNGHIKIKQKEMRIYDSNPNWPLIWEISNFQLCDIYFSIRRCSLHTRLLLCGLCANFFFFNLLIIFALKYFSLNFVSFDLNLFFLYISPSLVWLICAFLFNCLKLCSVLFLSFFFSSSHNVGQTIFNRTTVR